MVERPRTDEDAAILDSEARLERAGRRTRVLCHLCGQTYNAAQGHLGSDFCAINQRLRVHLEHGYEVVDKALHRLAKDAGVRTVFDMVGAEYSYTAFRQTKAGLRLLAPVWFAVIARRTRRMQRERRLALLRAVQADAMEEARARIVWRRDVAWLLEAFSKARRRRGCPVLPIGGRLLAAWAQRRTENTWLSEEERLAALTRLRRSVEWGHSGAAAYLRQAPQPERSGR